jgi:hypothetical protein
MFGGERFSPGLEMRNMKAPVYSRLYTNPIKLRGASVIPIDWTARD